MRKKKQESLWIALGLLIAFVVWTVSINFVDVKAIGPQKSTVGFATINRFIHNLTGVHTSLYTITDWLGLVPICFIMGFGILGLCEWVKRKNFLRLIQASSHLADSILL